MMYKPTSCIYRVRFIQLKENEVRNVYTFKIINKTNDPYENVDIQLMSHEGKVEVVGGQVNIPKGGMYEGTVFIKIQKGNLSSSKEKIELGIYAEGELIDEANTNFSSPLQIK